MSSKNNSTSAGGAASNKYEARLCHVVKRPDFDGYGFNLHAEKGRPGQYIGKVDDGSPAEAAGLRQGDRILEVNGTNITSEAHKKVVELIKGIPNETKLLVIDPRADANDLKAAIAKSKSAAGHVDVNDNSKQSSSASSEKMTMEKTMTNGKDSLNENSNSNKQTTATTNQNKHDVNGSSTHNEDANNKKNSSNNSNSNSANNNVDTTANNNKKMTTTTTPAMTNGEAKKQQPTAAPVEHIIEDTKTLSVSGTATAESNGKMMASANGSAKDGPKLNLNMTAAELRAQLAARKKYDPKNDVCDLRKKYEIIQKM